MVGKLSVAVFILNLILLVLALNDHVSGYILFVLPIIGIIFGVIGIIKKEFLSKTGVWTNAIFLLLFTFLVYVPPMMLGS
jgi:hypothetical protein